MAEMQKAYSLLDVKAMDEGGRRFSGMATTPAPDRDGDIIDPMGATYADDLPLLWQHRADTPVGRVKFGKPTPKGIAFEAWIPEIDEAGQLRDEVEKAWQAIRYGLVRAVSIGFRTLAYDRREGGGLLIKAWECLELSAVTIPANSQALISAVKSFDAAGMAAAIEDADGPPPAATGTKARVVRLAEPARGGAKPFIIRSIRR